MKKNKKMLCIAMGAITSVVIPATTILSCSSQAAPANIKVKIPTKETQSLTFTGLNGYGTFKIPTLDGTKVTASKQTNLKDNDSVVITYKLKKGYVWSNGKKDDIKLTFKVHDLEIDVKKPTKETKPLIFTGLNKKGTFVMPTLDGTTVTADHTKGLSNDSLVIITYTLLPDYKWDDKTVAHVELTFKVEGLNESIVKPTNESKPLKFTGVNGSGIFVMPTLDGTTVTANKKIGLNNGDSVVITYTLNNGYAWPDNSRDNVKLTFKVKGLDKPIVKPTNETYPLTYTGPNGSGTFKMPTLDGTTVTANRKTGLNNGDYVVIIYELNNGYAWSDNTKEDVKLTFKVEGLDETLTKPTNETYPLTYTGLNGNGTLHIKTLYGTTATADKTSGLSNGDKVVITYKLNKGYVWSNDLKGDVVLTFTVGTLQINVARPTNAIVPLDFYGSVGNGTYKLPKYKNTTVRIKEGGSGTAPATNLNKGDKVVLIFTLNEWCVWNTGSDNKPVELSYTIGTLPKAPDNTVLTKANVSKYTTHNAGAKSYTVWEGITKITDGAFEMIAMEDTDIQTLVLPNSLTSLNMAFNGYKIKNLTLGAGLTTIPMFAFEGALLTNLVIPDSVTTIDRDAFSDSPLTSLNLGKGIQKIGENAFNNAKLTTLVVPDSMRSIAESAFEDSPITSLTFEGDPSSGPTLSGGTFSSTPIASVQGENWLKWAKNKYKEAFKGDEY